MEFETNGRTDRRREYNSRRLSVRPSLRWSLTLKDAGVQVMN